MDDRALFERLRAWRNEQALKEAVEPFRVFQNATLELTAQVKPQSVEDLAGLKGWGKKKIERYGRAVLALIGGGEGGAEKVKKEEEDAEGYDFSVGSSAGEPVVLTVGACVGVMNSALERVGGMTVRGEISDVSGGRNGYAFFDLKDTSGQDYVVKCFIGRWQLEKFKHLVENGLEVIIVARPSIYKSGNLSLMVETIEPYGAGALQKAFEALKNKLAAQGLFNEERKRRLPSYIQNIGLITSESGAAINDFKRNLGEYGFKVFLYDVRVEGVHAEKSLVKALRWFATEGPQVDVIVLIRGGGGLENLKAFNSEPLALTIAQSRVPVITGIGHEKDVSIADFVADKYFSTPTAVAAFLRSQREELMTTFQELSNELIGAVESIVAGKKEYMARAGESLVLVVEQLFERSRLRMRTWYSDMRGSIQNVFALFAASEQKFFGAFVRAEHTVAVRTHELNLSAQRLLNTVERSHKEQERRLSVFEAALTPLDPSAILKRGYSVVYSDKKRVVKDAHDVRAGDRLTIKLFKGSVQTKAEKITN